MSARSSSRAKHGGTYVGVQVYGGCGVEMCVYRITQTHAYIVTDIQHPHLNTHDQIYIYIHSRNQLAGAVDGGLLRRHLRLDDRPVRRGQCTCVRASVLFVCLVGCIDLCVLCHRGQCTCVRTYVSVVWCGWLGRIYLYVCVFVCTITFLSAEANVCACVHACVPT